MMFPRSSFLYKCLTVVFLLIVFIYSFLFQRVNQQVHKRLPWQKSMDIIQRDIARTTLPNVAATRSRSSAKARDTTQPFPDPVTKKPSVNPHDYTYILNPVSMCTGSDIYLIIYVHTAPINFRKRQIIRHTWGDPELLKRFNARLVFVMGKVSDTKLMGKVKAEFDHYGDVVQENFVDTYRNLTYKGICALKWISSYCKGAQFALKSDDDILVNIFKISDHIRNVVTKQYGTKSLILCNQWVRMKVLRDKKSKWFIPKEQFELDYFPPYCSGSAFILSADVVKRMYEASFDTPFFWVDDYYVTGALAKKINVVQKRLNEMYMLNGRIASERFKNDTKHQLAFFHVPKLNTIYRMWTAMKKDMEAKYGSNKMATSQNNRTKLSR